MLNMLEWMQKRKHRIVHREHEGYVVQPYQPTSTEESLKGYIFIV